MKEYEYHNNQIKFRILGNTRYVGELYKVGMLSINVMNTFICQLVQSDNETELESLCKLIPAIAAEMEREEKAEEVIYLTNIVRGKSHPIFILFRPCQQCSLKLSRLSEVVVPLASFHKLYRGESFACFKMRAIGKGLVLSLNF